MALIAGVDEAGRGALAGPVVAAAVILPENHRIEGLRDSKKLTPKKREKLFFKIQEHAVSVAVGRVESKFIDKSNIVIATHKAMQMAIGCLSQKPDKALIDGYALPNQIIPNEGIIKGDSYIDEIMAASIIAKVTRDRIMIQYDVIFPEYGFARHKGYGTKQHMEALEKSKAALIHRKTFNPVTKNLPSMKWLRSQKRIGQWGERCAAMYLLDKKYKVEVMNVNCSPYGEIDIIARKNNELIFTEVKTISKEQLGSPELKVDVLKLSKLERAIEHYMMKNDLDLDIRLDVITVSLLKRTREIKHFKGVEFD